MRAGQIESVGGIPVIRELPIPVAPDGMVVVEVRAAGLNPSDQLFASGRRGDLPVPRVIGNEGVGILNDQRVYFERSVVPYGAFAEYAVVDPLRVTVLDDTINDTMAVTLGISSLAGWVPLEVVARLQPGERVLVLGASGPVGQAAVQAAHLLGAGHVVAAARHLPSMQRLMERGVINEIVDLGRDDFAEELKRVSLGGFNVVVDPLFGRFFAAGLRATAPGARVVSIGRSAEDATTLPWIDLHERAVYGYSNLTTAHEIKAKAYRRMMDHAAAGRFEIDAETMALDDIEVAWHCLAAGPHRKVVLTI